MHLKVGSVYIDQLYESSVNQAMAISAGIINDPYEEGNVSCVANMDETAGQVTMVDNVSVKTMELEDRNTIDVATDPALPGLPSIELKELPTHLEYTFFGGGATKWQSLIHPSLILSKRKISKNFLELLL